MSQIYRLWQKAILLPMLMLVLALSALAQPEADTTLTPRYIATGPNSNGFYEYLPKGYVEGTAKYPLIISLHGDGELGNGTTQLPILLDDAIPMYINEHLFPESVTVNGQTTSFIVIIPQFVAWPVNTDVDAVITYAEQNYRVDVNRIYLTGYSMGGGATWTYAGGSAAYANKLAAIFVVAGAKAMNAQMADIIAAANLPVFATNNSGDPVIPDTVTINNVNLINAAVPPPAIKAIDTIFNAAGHDAWTVSYNPFTIYSNGLNVYQWMAQFSLAATEPLPLTLTSFTAVLAPDNAAVAIDWTTASEQNNKYFILQRSGDGATFSDLDTVVPASPNSATARSYSYADQAPLAGNNFYRLTQVDMDGAVNYYGIREVSLPAARTTSLGISPNPCTDHIFVQFGDAELGPLVADIIDTRGQVVRRWTSEKQQPDWSDTFIVSDLPPGQYFLRLTVNHERRIQAFIKL
jgi:predicted esterase